MHVLVEQVHISDSTNAFSIESSEQGRPYFKDSSLLHQPTNQELWNLAEWALGRTAAFRFKIMQQKQRDVESCLYLWSWNFILVATSQLHQLI